MIQYFGFYEIIFRKNYDLINYIQEKGHWENRFGILVYMKWSFEEIIIQEYVRIPGKIINTFPKCHN